MIAFANLRNHNADLYVEGINLYGKIISKMVERYKEGGQEHVQFRIRLTRLVALLVSGLATEETACRRRIINLF